MPTRQERRRAAREAERRGSINDRANTKALKDEAHAERIARFLGLGTLMPSLLDTPEAHELRERHPLRRRGP